VNRELAARGVESALWLAVLTAQHAGVDDAFITDLLLLHTEAGRRRRAIESLL
jgi:hypothetical protein